jgi:hypothetical protein
MSTKQKILARTSGLALVLILTMGLVVAQSPSPSPAKPDSSDKPIETGENAGDYTVISSLEFGYRGLSVDGDHNKYQSDLNYKAGPRLFDSSFLLRSKESKGTLFETFLITSTGWGADPHGNVRASVEQPEWYRFDATYRRFKYFRFLNSFANPNWVFSPTTFNVPPKPENMGSTREYISVILILRCSRKTNSSGLISVTHPSVIVDQHSSTITLVAMNS